MATDRVLVLLGPQRENPSLRGAMRWLDTNGPVGLVLAGRQQEEGQDEQIREAIGVPAVNLSLFERAEKLFQEDTELFEQLRIRQDRLRAARDAYRLRLDLALEAIDRIRNQSDQTRVWLEAYHDSLDVVRRLDRWHLAQSQAIISEFDRQLLAIPRAALAKQCADIAAILKKTKAIVIGGGHVAVLLNRLRMFNVVEQSGRQPIVAWSAAAMALSERVVLFHDSPPQGRGHAEVLRAGLRLFEDRIMLPDARRRLSLGNKDRVAMFASRFSPTRCVILDETTELRCVDGRWTAPRPISGLMDTGSVGMLSP